MKSIHYLVAGLAVTSVAAWCGCASEKHPLMLEAVGPTPIDRPVPNVDGELVVFSAAEPTAHFSSLPYRVYYSDYKLLSGNGVFLRVVHNDSGTGVEGPSVVSLPAGSYRVAARANGYGQVTVPVVIAAHQVTTVHLDGGGIWGTDAPAVARDAVRLPDGQIIGWRADTNVPSPAATASPAVKVNPSAPQASARSHS